MRKGGNWDALLWPPFWTYIPCSLGEGCQSFYSLFLLLSYNFIACAINVHTITFHIPLSLQVPFHGCWSTNSSIALLFASLQILLKPWWSHSTIILVSRKQHLLSVSTHSITEANLTDDLSIFGMTCPETNASCSKHTGAFMDTSREATVSCIKAVTTKEAVYSPSCRAVCHVNYCMFAFPHQL